MKDGYAKQDFAYPSEGRMPQERGEIALDTLTLKRLGIEKHQNHAHIHRQILCYDSLLHLIGIRSYSWDLHCSQS